MIVESRRCLGCDVLGYQSPTTLSFGSWAYADQREVAASVSKKEQSRRRRQWLVTGCVPWYLSTRGTSKEELPN
jgi:hypothetical protein